MRDFDVVVAGAGPGGCVAARDLARRGFRVGLFDAAPEGGTGKPIVVEIERGAFAAAGIEDPSGDMIAYHPTRVRFISPRGRTLFSFDPRAGQFPVAVFLDRLVAGLLDDAKKTGVDTRFGYRAEGPVMDGGRVAGVRFMKSGGAAEVRAPLVIDATGFSSAVVRALPPHCGCNSTTTRATSSQPKTAFMPSTATAQQPRFGGAFTATARSGAAWASSGATRRSTHTFRSPPERPTSSSGSKGRIESRRPWGSR
ncbi:MAG: FAD-dependent oxidoreductase [Deltaproteobacteria bacterium]|nr:FAD-dependent oxidoreductase [Deltaproteobacteria bacterium]